MLNADFFVSSALGVQKQYRAYFSDQVFIIMLAKTNQGGLLTCHDIPSQAFVALDWNEIHHTADQVKQVLKDMDAATNAQK